jgi:1,5-anhydro-D-fructose reductase (1,5-anhydro-D-mannitol-forming)
MNSNPISSNAISASTTSKTIKWGIVGVGEVCEVKSGPGFYKAKQSSLQAVMRRTMSKAEDYAKRHSVPTFYNKIDELVNDDNVNAIYVSTPPGGNRVQIAQDIVKAGKPAYFEKPLARDAKEAQQIVNLFNEAKLPLYVAFYRRYMPKFRNVKENILNQNKIGHVTSVRLTLHQSDHLHGQTHRWHYDREVSGGGKFMDVGCHMLDLVDYFIGPLENVQGVALRNCFNNNNDDNDNDENAFLVEDSVHGIWTHSIQGSDGDDKINKISGSCSFNFSSGGANVDEILITGTKGTITMSCFDNEPVKMLTLDEKQEKSNKKEEILLEHDNLEHVQLPTIQAISNELLQLDEDNLVVSTGESALRTSVVCDLLLNNRSAWDDNYV